MSILKFQCAKTDLSYDADLLHKVKLRQKQPIAGKIFKILVGELNYFCLQQNFMIMNYKFLYESGTLAEKFLRFSRTIDSFCCWKFKGPFLVFRINVPFQVTTGGVRLLLERCENLVWRKILVGADLVMFRMIGGIPPQPTQNGKTFGSEFSRPIRLLDSFTRNFSRKTLPLEFIFCMTDQHHDWNLQNKFWLLMTFEVLSRCSFSQDGEQKDPLPVSPLQLLQT